MRLRVLPLVVVAALAGAGTAQATVTAPDFRPPPFAKGVPLPGIGANLTLAWAPASFSPQDPLDRVDVVLHNDTLDTTRRVEGLARDATTVTLPVLDGVQYTISVQACRSAGPCSSQPPGSVFASTGTLRVDATAPSGSVLINGGAPFTNRRDVTLDVSGDDPDPPALPGTASGVSQVAVDLDGDGTYPCGRLLPPGEDRSGCAQGFAPAVPVTLPGLPDGPQRMRVKLGDGARAVLAPCTGFCVPFDTGELLGNVSPEATDTIVLDTARPVAVASQSRFAVERGEAVTFDAAPSFDLNPAVASGVDPAGARWDFKDRTAGATGQRIAHVFSTVGTFVGELRVSDRAGNQSEPRPVTVTVTPRPAETASGAGVVGQVTQPNAASFKVDSVKVRARYQRSRLRGSILLSGSAADGGELRVEVRQGTSTLARFKAAIPAGAFNQSFALPAALLPGRYQLAITGPGGSARSSLRLLAPREGVLKSARVRVSGAGARATFVLATLPVKALRRNLMVAWSQGTRVLGRVPVAPGARVAASPPPGSPLRAGPVTAVLRAGVSVVGVASWAPSHSRGSGRNA